jgi:A/G-specific adenine glycosylase
MKSSSIPHKKFFTSCLLSWNGTKNTREMPWKGEKDPYKIWLSEIILQQTRVQQGLAYYNQFIKTFPDIKSLATAPEQKIFKLWEGLGYYTRCSNLIATAKFIHENLDDQFPQKYEDILSLKGIGSYTASAIASFAYNEPYAVLDGNVFRVLSRFFGIEMPINTTQGKKYYGELAQLLIDKKNPAEYNQAIMDFGAIICKPSSPLCDECPFQKKCVAFLDKTVSVLPINEKTIKQQKRYFNYIIATYNKKYYIKERTQKDIWQHLYEFILIETESLLNEKDFLHSDAFLSIFEKNEIAVKNVSKIYSQKLTHQLIKGQFFFIQINHPLKKKEGFRMVTKKQLSALPFPKFIVSYLTDKNVSLNLF